MDLTSEFLFAVIAAWLCGWLKLKQLPENEPAPWSAHYADLLQSVFGETLWRGPALRRLAAAVAVSYLAALVLVPQLWLLFWAPPQADSFFTLSAGGQIGLLILSLLLVFVLTLISLAKTIALVQLSVRLKVSTPLGLATALVDGLVTLVLVSLLLAVSPQIYYFYYRILIPDLPLQWVLAAPPGASALWDLLRFAPSASLAQHLTGLALLASLLPSLAGPLLAVGRRSCALTAIAAAAVAGLFHTL